MKRLQTQALALIAIVLIASSAQATTHTVTQSGLTFSPNDLTITVGDTVQWVWSDGIHTVTNGTDLSDPNLGTLFDAPLDAAHLTFTFVFTAAGDVPYLCRPHVSFGMTGIIRVQPNVGVDDTPAVAAVLGQNAPNPFNPRTEIAFAVPAPFDGQHVALRIFDLRGGLVRTLVDRSLPAGPATVTWDGLSDLGRAMPSGTYVYRLNVGAHIESRRMTLVR